MTERDKSRYTEGSVNIGGSVASIISYSFDGYNYTPLDSASKRPARRSCLSNRTPDCHPLLWDEGRNSRRATAPSYLQYENFAKINWRHFRDSGKRPNFPQCGNPNMGDRKGLVPHAAVPPLTPPTRCRCTPSPRTHRLRPFGAFKLHNSCTVST
ncbi:hypothetical protein EVAR_29648_1 [Eumeta japonica]|uniref:Uncharacterized protein n=1 Tax=Eumeta variegata TaxID=151549 RepID=A0A4C1W6P6_EUMVA|nr:hypothetical protein EVAR_29648_1 [Eumeta japonica]